MKTGDRIRELRCQLGMTQDDLAKKLGYTSNTTIAKIEANASKVKSSKLMQIAQALNTTPAYLMGWESEEEIEKEVNNLTDSQARFMAYYLGLSKDKQEKIEQMAKLIGE